MTARIGLWLLAGLLFAGFLFYMTLEYAPSSPPTGVDHSATAAEDYCQVAVRDSLGEVLFPFGANAEYLGESRYRLDGVVDYDDPGGPVRTNYECWVRYIPDVSTYRTDSINLWQSH